MNKQTEFVSNNAKIPNCLDLCKKTMPILESITFEIKKNLINLQRRRDEPTNIFIEEEQFLSHGFAWIATYIEGLNQLLSWAENIKRQGKFSSIESLILQIGFGEYLGQIKGGIQMSQSEIIRLDQFNLSQEKLIAFDNDPLHTLITSGNSDTARKEFVELLSYKLDLPAFYETGLDSDYESIRDLFHRFSKEKIRPNAHRWHLKNELIPMKTIRELSELGVFGLTIPESFGGLGMKKTAMCIVSEELSRGYIGVGSLATRSEIAAELIIRAGTEEQKKLWLNKIAKAEILPAAVFTEPNVGSDLGNIQTKAKLEGKHYYISGNKTWITHASRANMMTLLARTDQCKEDHKGLSMFLINKNSGTDNDPFPNIGLEGTEIEVLGYRGMKEYELSFDKYRVEKKSLLGQAEGQGFRQLMETFETARIQTAARAVGVAQNALDLALKYAMERKQFGKNLLEFPRVYGKLAHMAVELVISRQLTYFSSREKDAGRRCDMQAGMAKMLSARVAWSAADSSLQVHGGNGFALDYEVSRVLCDARILSIFEGAAEIQAQIIARRLFDQSKN